MGTSFLGGTAHWRTLTMSTAAEGDVAIAKGDAVKLSAAFAITNATSAEDVPIGQAAAGSTDNGALLPVLVSGIGKFRFTGVAPEVNGAAGVLASATNGKVKKPASGNGFGRNLKTEITKQTLTLASVQAGDEVTINGLAFTAHASATDAAKREFKIDGNDTADAVALAGVINDSRYGVKGVTAAADAGVITLSADDPDETLVSITDAAATMTAAVSGGNVFVLM